MDLHELYHLLAASDNYTFDAQLLGHDVDMCVRNSQQLRNSLNPPPLLRHNTYYPDRITYDEVQFTVTAMAVTNGVRAETSSYQVYKSVREAADKLARSEFYHMVLPDPFAGATFLVKGAPFFITSYEQIFDTNILYMSARPTMRAVGK